MIDCIPVLFYLAHVQHIEFVHSNHFEINYHRYHVTGPLSLFIDFFWQTKFEDLWHQYPQGFSDVLFPNLGYSYLVNLGTAYDMQVDEERRRIKGDGFLPRLHHIEAFHKPGNVLFGIKFKVSPVLFEKKVNFSEYNGGMYPLSYLMDGGLLLQVKKAASFEQRVKLLMNYYGQLTELYKGSLVPIHIVTEILQRSVEENIFTLPVEELAARYSISSRTLQRYFEMTTGVGSKQALQVLRIRKAVEQIVRQPGNFHYTQFGYYDYSHFHKHLRSFLQKENIAYLQPHLQLLKRAKGK
ncbi:MAG: helix-turn-helix domain-containing protein [Lacibacter sp.]